MELHSLALLLLQIHGDFGPDKTLDLTTFLQATRAFSQRLDIDVLFDGHQFTYDSRRLGGQALRRCAESLGGTL